MDICVLPMLLVTGGATWPAMGLGKPAAAAAPGATVGTAMAAEVMVGTPACEIAPDIGIELFTGAAVTVLAAVAGMDAAMPPVATNGTPLDTTGVAPAPEKAVGVSCMGSMPPSRHAARRGRRACGSSS